MREKMADGHVLKGVLCLLVSEQIYNVLRQVIRDFGRITQVTLIEKSRYSETSDGFADTASLI